MLMLSFTIVILTVSLTTYRFIVLDVLCQGMSRGQTKRYAEIELTDLDLDPIPEAIDRPSCEVVSSYEWKQLPLEERKNYDLVVAPHSAGGLKVYETEPNFDRGELDLHPIAHVITPESGRRSEKPSKEDLINELQRLRDQIEEPPTASDIRNHTVYSPATYQYYFDSLTDARKEADVGEPLPAGDLSKEDAKEILQDVEEETEAGTEDDVPENNELTLAPDIVPNLLADLDISDESDVAETAMELAKRHGTTGDNLISGAPSSIAAASVYTASLLKNEHRSQVEVAEAAGMSETTLRNNFHRLLETYQTKSE